MSSKGVDYYAYLSNNPFSVTFSKPIDWGRKTEEIPLSQINTMLGGNLQINQSDVQPLQTGRFQWIARSGSNQLFNGYADINPIWGILGDSNMDVMLDTPSIINSDYALSYGFYGSAPSENTLMNQNQSYVYLTDNYSTWMGDLIKAEPALSERPFSTFALPGAHDCGMFDPTEVKKILNNPIFKELLTELLGEKVAALTESVLLRVIINLAFTQKDTIPTMLNLGTRYFDFRPGYCYKNIAPGIFHQHNFIPGYSYASFLNDVLIWLNEHPSELVVVSANFQGFASDEMKPTVETLNSMVVKAQSETHTQNIIIGDKSDRHTSIESLLQENKRLIFLNQIDAPNDASKYDSYNGDLYTTTDVNNILQALEDMQMSQQEKYDYTVLQLQGTASGLPAGIISALINDSSSPLLATKANFDQSTYPWLAANVKNKFAKDNLIIFLNDYADNALADYASQITRQRTAK